MMDKDLNILFDAVINEDIYLVKKYINSEFEINKEDEYGLTLL